MRIENRKAKFDYHIEEVFKAGISLLGSEVKSIKAGKANLIDSFCYFNEESLLLKGMHITPSSSAFSHDPLRERILLLKKEELSKLKKNLDKGFTIIPLSVWISNGWIKIDIALVKGKREWDKRQTIKDRDLKRELHDLPGKSNKN